MEDWLRSIGLGHLIAVFLDNRDHPRSAPGADREDLRELGLTIGERKRLVRALATDLPVEQPAVPHTPPASEHSERRPLTVMFIDLENSTAIGERLDPEDMLDLIRAYRSFCGTPSIASAVPSLASSATAF